MSGTVKEELQKSVGQPSFFISGPANCVNVSLIMITCVMLRSSSRNSFAPGSGYETYEELMAAIRNVLV